MRSPALVADGRHLLTDVVTSAGVIVGLLLVPLDRLAWLDPVLAASLPLNILWSGWGLMKESVGGLMDEALPEAMLGRVREVIADQRGGRHRGPRPAHPPRRPDDLHRFPSRGAGWHERDRRPRHLRPPGARAEGRDRRMR